ncbi:kallikrein-7-like [Lycorma delicatula]|uniref:kallikrein-7-like n=1 Tax=Lycorma delicatula TaxID=130591 RepID=UPI003F5149E5
MHQTLGLHFNENKMMLIKTVIITQILTTLFCNVTATPNEGTITNHKHKNEMDEQKTKSINDNEATDHMITGIIGGRRASIKNYPYTAAILQGGLLMGSGVILNNKWLLTTGTLLHEADPSILIRGGTDKVICKGQARRAAKRIVHSNYTYPWLNNVGLIKLKKPFKFNKNLKAIKIGHVVPQDGKKAVLSGFGITIETRGDKKTPLSKSDLTGQLQASSLEVITYHNCKKYYDSDSFTNRNYCTAVNLTTSPCLLDDGSPLVFKKNLVGLFCGTSDCGNPTKPTIYTDITYKEIKDWIHATIKRESNPSELQEFYNTKYYE